MMYPDRTVAVCSYEHHFARKWGRNARDLVIEHGWHLGVQISDTQSAANDWETNHGGGMITAGVGGPLTGRGAHLLVIDDALKNAEQAISPTIRENQWEWWLSTAKTRLEPGGVAVVMGTRWHQDDLIGRLLRQQVAGEIELTRIRLTAIAEDDDILGRQPGEPLWPSRFPLAELERIRRESSDYWWNAMYQARPTKSTKTEWPADYFGPQLLTDDWPDAFQLSVIVADPSKGTNATKGDYSAILFVGTAGGLYWVWPDIARRPAEQIIADLMTMHQRFNPDLTGLESNSFQHLLEPLLYQHCQRENIAPPAGLHLIHNTLNKQLRIGRLGPLLKNGVLRIARNAPGTALLLEQLQEFPLSDYDDGPDTLEMGIRLINEAAE